MTEAQGWMALILGVVSLGVLVWRLGAGFAGIRKDIHWMKTTNDADHQSIDQRLISQGRSIGHARDRISKMEGRFRSLDCVYQGPKRPNKDEGG